MSLLETVNASMIAAMKARDGVTLGTLRMLKTALTMKIVEKGRDLDDAESLQVVASLVKQRHDSIDQFQKGGRLDLVAKETAEIVILEKYLPAAASADDISAAIEQAVAETGASSVKDMGKVLKAAMARLTGKTVDGKAVNEAVRKRLAG